MKYFSIQAADSTKNVVRRGLITFADKWRKDSNGVAFVKSNGRKVCIPYSGMSEQLVKSLFMGCSVEFTLNTDGKRVWGENLKVLPIPNNLVKHPFYRELPDLNIKLNSIKKIQITNRFHNLSEELQRKSDLNHIPRRIYDCINILTIGESYDIFKKGSLMKGVKQVDDLKDFIDLLYMRLGLGSYEEIEHEGDYRERIITESTLKEQINQYEQKIKNEIEVVTNSIIKCGDIKLYGVPYKSGGYCLSYDEEIHPIWDLVEYFGESSIESFISKAKGSGKYKLIDEFLVFDNLGSVNGLAKKYLIEEKVQEFKNSL